MNDLPSVVLTYSKAEFVPPPPSQSSSVTQIFQAEDFASESDPYCAYAFGGPYRWLHQIAQPHPWDKSSWAENLRWAFEQRVLFLREHSAAVRWNESPEHMECIEQERTRRVWASDELLDQLLGDTDTDTSFEHLVL